MTLSIFLVSVAYGITLFPVASLIRLSRSLRKDGACVNNFFYPSVVISALLFMAAAVTKYLGW